MEMVADTYVFTDCDKYLTLIPLQIFPYRIMTILFVHDTDFTCSWWKSASSP